MTLPSSVSLHRKVKRLLGMRLPEEVVLYDLHLPDFGYLFDAQWYLATYPDVAAAGVPPQVHYQSNGWREGRYPSLYFWTVFYMDAYELVKSIGKNPLEHYMEFGWREGRDPNPVFDAKWYKSRYLGGAAAELDAFEHYLTVGAAVAFWPHPLFDPNWYAARYDLTPNSLEPIRHFLAQGNLAVSSPNEFFDCVFYRSRYIDPSHILIHPLTHFLRYGSKHGIAPSEKFDTARYLEDNPDVAASAMNPLAHYLHYGLKERRQTSGADRAKDFHNASELLVGSLKRNLTLFLAGSNNLDFNRKNASITISVVVVLHNKAFFSLSCFEHLCMAHHSCRDIEIDLIIFDNASDDETNDVLERLQGVRIIRSNTNIGYLRAVNSCLSAAHGDYTLLLNNDAFILPSAIEAAYNVFVDEPNAGVVGGRLILPNNRLQEAGSIIWSDASCMGYRRDADPEDPTVMYRRDVDYVSGAFLMIRSKTIEVVGCFDEALAPAYYEESDYCMRARQNGWRVIYDPGIAVMHFEFGSALSRETAAAQMRHNQPFIRKKHIEYLASCLEPSPSASFLASDARRQLIRVLIVDDRVPFPWLGSGFPRSASLIGAIFRSLGDKGMITLLTTDEKEKDWYQIRSVLPMRVEVAFAAHARDFHHFMAQRASCYDVVMVSRPHNMRRVREFIKSSGTEVLGNCFLMYDAEAIFSRREALERQLAGDAFDSEMLARKLDEEIELARGAQIITTVNEDEASEFRKRTSVRVEVLGHSLNPDPTENPFESREGFLFVGGLVGENSPNVDSMCWFLKNVWPSLRGQCPGLQLFVVGNVQSDIILQSSSDGVALVGKVDDLSEWYNRARVFVAPTRFAAGIPHKVHEAASRGLPSVVTQVLANQLGWITEREAMVGTTPAEFASCCLKLHNDKECWWRVRKHALRAVSEECNPRVFEETVRSIFGEALQAKASSRGNPAN